MKKHMLAALLSTLLLNGNLYAQEQTAAIKSVAKQQQSRSFQVEQKDNIALLTINDLPRNTTSIAVLNGINNLLDLAENNPDISAIVITGTGNVFSSGAGSEGIRGIKYKGKTHAELAYETFRRMEAFPKVIIAAVNGMSAGGGNELALASDIRIAGENALFRQHELQAGLIPGFGGTQRLVRLIGRSKAMQMMLTGDAINAQQALQFGLVAKVVADDKVVAEAIKLGKYFDAVIDKKALAVFKQRMSQSLDEDYDTALKNDQIAFDARLSDPQTMNAIKKFVARQKANKEVN